MARWHQSASAGNDWPSGRMSSLTHASDDAASVICVWRRSWRRNLARVDRFAGVLETVPASPVSPSGPTASLCACRTSAPTRFRGHRVSPFVSPISGHPGFSGVEFRETSMRKPRNGGPQRTRVDTRLAACNQRVVGELPQRRSVLRWVRFVFWGGGGYRIRGAQRKRRAGSYDRDLLMPALLSTSAGTPAERHVA